MEGQLNVSSTFRGSFPLNTRCWNEQRELLNSGPACELSRGIRRATVGKMMLG